MAANTCLIERSRVRKIIIGVADDHVAISEGLLADIDDLPIITIASELTRLRAGLDRAAYALFQIKRMKPEAVRAFAEDAHAKACNVLDGEQAPEAKP
jgi:hypothetical protein